MRTVGIRVEDPKFRDGGRPAVDIEVEYLLDTWGGVSLYADTEQGSELVADGWGGGKKWQTLKTTLDNAWFGSREHGGGGAQITNDGHDLRLVAPNAPLFVRSVKVTGHPLTGDVDWRRLLKLKAPETGHPAGLLVFERGDASRLSYELRNIAEEAIPPAVRLRGPPARGPGGSGGVRGLRTRGQHHPSLRLRPGRLRLAAGPVHGRALGLLRRGGAGGRRPQAGGCTDQRLRARERHPDRQGPPRGSSSSGSTRGARPPASRRSPGST